MRVPFVDLSAQRKEIGHEIDAAIRAVIEANAFIQGPYVERFEADFGALVGAKHVIGVSNGTDALHLVLRALGIGPGDEVILPAATFTATGEAVWMAGARCVFADIDSRTRTITASTVEPVLTPRTRAILPVHLYGQLAPMDDLLELARSRGLEVVEDAAQAHCAERGGRSAGSFGRAGTFSFYPGKNLGAYGDAGAIVTDDAELEARVRRLRDHGRSGKHDYDERGFNNRLDGLQAAILSAKIPHLRRWTAARIAAADRYRRGLADIPGLTLPPSGTPGEAVYHLFVVEASKRETLARRLGDAGIATGVHYPTPLHLLPAYADVGKRLGDLPATEALFSRCLSLPMFAEIRDEQIEHVVSAIRSVLCESRT